MRLVRCPSCRNILVEPANYSVYRCGGCGALLCAKHKGYVSGSLSDDGKVGVGGDFGKSESSLEKGLVDRSDASDVDAKSSSGPSRDENQRDVDKVGNMDEKFLNQSEGIGEKGVFDDDVDVNGSKDEVGKAMGREQEEAYKSRISRENGSKFSGRISNWQNGERSEMEGFWRNPRAGMESVRFCTSKYPDEGPSKGFFSNCMGSWRNRNKADGANMLQHLQQDQAELLRKLDGFKVHLSESSELVNNLKEKIIPDDRTMYSSGREGYTDRIIGMVNLGTIFNTDVPAGFTWAVDNAIRSSSEEETSPVPSFGSVVNNAINSDGAEDVEEDFQLFTRAETVATSTNNFSLEVENEIVYRGDQSCSGNTIKKSFKDFSLSNHTGDPNLLNVVTVNGKPISNCVIKKAEKLAGPIQPGNYWYDFRGGFWGVMGGPCLGIIPPFIEEFNHPLPYNCSDGNTDVYVNGRELHQNDLDLLVKRGLPTNRDRSYIIDISGRVLDEDTGEELDSLGKLAPALEKMKHGFGMRVPRFQPQCHEHETRTEYNGVE